MFWKAIKAGILIIGCVMALGVPIAALVWASLRWGFLTVTGIGILGFLGLCFAVGVFFLLPYVFIWITWQERASRRELRVLAARHGWNYLRRADKALAAQLSSFLVPPVGEYGQFSDVVTGTEHGWPFFSFRCIYTISTGQQDPIYGGEVTDSSGNRFVLLNGLPASAPTVTCQLRREPVTDPGSRMGDYLEGFLTGNAAFDEAFDLNGPAALLVGGFGGQIGALMPRLVSDVGRAFQWRLTAGALLTWDHEAIGTNARELAQLLTALAAIADLL